jgi:hypothetical protein
VLLSTIVCFNSTRSLIAWIAISLPASLENETETSKVFVHGRKRLKWYEIPRAQASSWVGQKLNSYDDLPIGIHIPISYTTIVAPRLRARSTQLSYRFEELQFVVNAMI